MTTTLYRGVTLPDGSTADVLVDGPTITEVGAVSRPVDIDIDAVGLQALPGLVDLHTHLREPGFEESETVLTGSQAAAAGGYTTVFAMANTDPVADNVPVVELVAARGEEAGYVHVQPIGAVTRGLQGFELADLRSMAQSRANVRVFSDDGKCVFDPLVMRRALEYVSGFGGVIAQHAQEPRLTEHAQMHEGHVSMRLGLAGWPSVAEEAIIARDVLLAAEIGANLHICHVSTAGSVEVLRWAKGRGINVTAEVTPHHLLLTHESASDYDARFKVNPPLRREEDVLALRAALADGTIDIVATDHAPHPAESKECEWDAASFGMVGLETALSVVQMTMVDTGLLTWSDIERVMSRRPAEIGRHSWSGVLPGNTASFTLVDASARRTLTPSDLSGRSTNSPYLGRDLPGRVIHTVFAGVRTVNDGRVATTEELAHERREVQRG